MTKNDSDQIGQVHLNFNSDQFNGTLVILKLKTYIPNPYFSNLN